MVTHLLIAVRLPGGRFHGDGDHPPAPARLFQALVAGAGLGGPDELEKASAALGWLERLAPPVVAAPPMTKGQRVKNYVPNNDLDAKSGDRSRIGEIRTEKSSRPWLFDGDVPLLYVWELSPRGEDERAAQTACILAKHLYQFGRGVDSGWAWGEVLESSALEERLHSYPGRVYRPAGGEGGTSLACPVPGSLASLKTRYAAGRRRLTRSDNGRQLFVQQPKAHFGHVAYDSLPSRHVFELQATGDNTALGAWPLTRASKLVVILRDSAVARLAQAMPGSRAEIERFLVGRASDGGGAAVPAGSRIRIVPIPSIGHEYADHRIRRLMVEVPASCPLRSDDVRWAFSGLDVVDRDTGEAFDLVVTASSDDSMLGHYSGRQSRVGHRVWRTVTPAVLPEAAKRRRIDPGGSQVEPKSGSELAIEQRRAVEAVHQALRHAQVPGTVGPVRVQREPFNGRGQRVEPFAAGTRFEKHRLWHVEVTFAEPVQGPLLIGDGRFLGLGLLAPLKDCQGVYALAIEEGLAPTPDAPTVARALRRALMARVQAVLPPRTPLPTFFSGHEGDQSPAHSHEHLTFTCDPVEERLLVVAPHVVGRRQPTRDEIRAIETLEQALVGFTELRAGSAGLLKVRQVPIITEEDPLFAASRCWASLTPYQVTRHVSNVGAAEALAADVRTECRRRQLPEVRVTAIDPQGISGVGLVGGALLEFETAVEGPVLLGKSRHLGGGLFAGTGVGRGRPPVLSHPLHKTRP